MFTFSSRVPGIFPITDIYFNDGRLMGIAVDMGLGNDSDVEPNGGISRLANNSHILSPDNQSTTIHVSRDFLIDKNPITPQSSYDQRESLAIVFDLQAGMGFADIICAVRDGSLRIKIKAQGPQAGDSRTLVNDSVPTLSRSSYLQ